MNTFVKYLINSIIVFFIICILYFIFSRTCDIISLLNHVISRKAFYISILIITLFVCYFLWKCWLYKYNWNIDFFENRAIPHIVILLSLLIGFYSIFATKVELSVDPKAYYYTAIDILQGKIELNIYNIYHRRVLLYTLPLFWVFPQSIITVKILNLILLIATAIGFRYLSIRLFNIKTANLFFTLFLLYPTHYFVINLPSHDLVSNFFLMLFCITLFYLSNNSQNRSNVYHLIILIITLSLILLFNELERSTSIFIVASLVIALILSWSKRKKVSKVFLLSLGVSILCYFAINIFAYKTLGKDIYKNHAEYSNAGRLYGHNNLYTNGNYFTGEVERLALFPLIDKKNWTSTAVTKYTTQFVNHPFEHIHVVLRKSSLLFDNSPYSYYFNQLTNRNYNQFVFILYSIIIFLILLGVIYFFISNSLYQKNSFLIYFIILYPGILISLMIFSEVNGYYSYILLPFLFFICASSLSNISFSRIRNNGAGIITALKKSIRYLFFLTGILSFIFLSSFIYISLSPLKLVDIGKAEKKYYNCMEVVDSDFSNKPYKLKILPVDYDSAFVVTISGTKNATDIRYYIKSNLKQEQFDIWVNSEKIELNKTNSKVYHNSTYAFINKHGKLVNCEISIKLKLKINSELKPYFEIRDVFTEKN